jgi:ketosteroid isomerase-like protein
MYSDNVTVVRALLDDYQRFNADALESCLHLDAKYTGPGADFGVDVVGRYQIIEHLKRSVFPAFERFQLELVRIWEDRDRAVVVVEWQGDFWPRAGGPYKNSGAFVFEFQDDLVFWMREYFDTARARMRPDEDE